MSKPRVKLVYAGIGIAGFNSQREISDREGVLISHGVASIAASTKAAGYDVSLLDLRKLTGWKAVGKRIRHDNADVYGISISAVDHVSALQLILEIKKNKPQAKIIVGGIHPTVFPEKYQFKVVDTVVLGEGEVTFIDLLDKITNNEPLPKIVNGVKPDLDAIPWVDRDFFDYRFELNCAFGTGHSPPAVTMLAGRGCPYHCTYCQPAENAVFGTPFRIRSAENVVEELIHLKNKYKFKSITFWDDTFTFRPKWVGEFCDLYDKAGIKAPIAACSRADIICNNEAMVERLARSGLDWFVIGVETGSQRLLDLIRKGTTVEQNIRSAEICRKYGIKVFATHMYGLPTETPEESEATYKMLQRIKPDFAFPFWYVPIPGTDLYRYCEENDLLLIKDQDAQNIERTGRYVPHLKKIDYNYLGAILERQIQ